MMNFFRLLAFIFVFLVFGSSAYAEEIKLKFRGASERANTGSSIDINVSTKMLEINKFSEAYNDYISQYERETKIDYLNLIAKGFIGDVSVGDKVREIVFRGSGPGKNIYANWKDSVFYIANPTAILEGEKIMLDVMGTGSLIDQRGLIITNHHVVENANQVWIYPASKDPSGELILRESDKFLTIVINTDKKADLALLKIVGLPKKIKPIPMGNLKDIFPGEQVFAIGHPKAYFVWSISDGIVSAIRPNYAWLENEATVIQNTAAISGGSSGGPLFNSEGKMIGINTMTYQEGQSLNFAVAINHVTQLIKNTDVSNIETAIESMNEEKLNETFSILGTGDYNKNGIIDEWWVDENSNGVADALYVDDNEDGLIELIYIDANENKIWDMLILDDDVDGRPNRQIIDRDEDEIWDIIAYDFDQDGTWDKFEDYKDRYPS
jgi:S1-C subfamily serine protease